MPSTARKQDVLVIMQPNRVLAEKKRKHPKSACTEYYSFRTGIGGYTCNLFACTSLLLLLYTAQRLTYTGEIDVYAGST